MEAYGCDDMLYDDLRHDGPPGTWRLSQRSDALLGRVLELYGHQGADVAPPRSGMAA